jgi:hypothetical protein
MGLESSPGTIEWAVMRGALATLLSISALSASLVYGAHYYLDHSHQRESKAQQELEQMEKLYAEGREAVEILESAYPRFRDFYARGFIGDEQRLLWINHLHDLESAVDIPALQYQIANTETALKIPGLTLAEDFTVYQNDMEIELGLLHEEDLFRVIKALRAQKTAGLFSVEHCTLEPLKSGGNYGAQAANFQAKCTLKWVYARLHKKK